MRGVPRKAGHEAVGRTSVDLFGRADLPDAAGAHDRDAIGERQRLDLVVGDVHHRRADLPVETSQLRPRLDARARVEVGERLVEQVGVGTTHERAREGDPLPLPAGELVRPALEQLADPDERRGLGDALAHLRLRRLTDDEPEADVLARRQMREERVALEHHRDVPGGGADVRDVASADRDRARVDGLEAGDAAEERALAAARGADDDEQLALARFERDRRRAR